MIKARFCVFQMQIHAFLGTSLNYVSRHFAKLQNDSMPINMSTLILAIVHTAVLAISDIYQTVMPAPAIAVNNTGWADFAHITRCNFSLGIQDDLIAHLSLAFKDAGDDRFPDTPRPGLPRIRLGPT